MLYLQRVDAGLDELYEARVVLEEIACDLASERTEPRIAPSCTTWRTTGSPIPRGAPTTCTR